MDLLQWQVLIIQGVCFLITFWFLKRMAWRPLLGVLANREAEIRGDYEKAHTEREHMEHLRQDYERKIAGAEAEAREHMKAAIQRANEKAGQILSDAQQQIQDMDARARMDLEREQAKAMAELRSHVGRLSVAIAGKIISEELDETKHHAMIDDFIDRIGAMS
jgi:F-type H+-transporting ATPase subunit b